MEQTREGVDRASAREEFAAAVTEKLAARDPEHYGPAARQLRERADQVLQRQKEPRR